MSGDAIINNRKKKLIPSYELEVRGTWTGVKHIAPAPCNVKLVSERSFSGALYDSGSSAEGMPTGKAGESSPSEGTFTLPYIADENADEDPEFKVTVTGDSRAAQQLKELFQTRGKQVRHAIAQ